MEPTVVVRAPVKVEETGPLTFGYFLELSEYIGDEWQQLAERLGIKRARIQVCWACFASTCFNFIMKRCS